MKTAKFAKWIDKAINYLGDGQGFCFNLYEDKKAWSCELVCTNEVDRNDEDWVCDEKEVFGREKPLEICKKNSIEDYEEFLTHFRSLLDSCSASIEIFHKLVENKTVAFGFVDGDLLYYN